MDDDLIFIRPPEDGMLRRMCVVENQNKYVDPEEIQSIRPTPINMKRQTPESDNRMEVWQLLGARMPHPGPALTRLIRKHDPV